MRMRIQVGQIDLRQFCEADMRELYCVRNHPTVRSHMSKPELIPYKSHVSWVNKNVLGNKNLLLFLVRVGTSKHAAGLTQLRISADAAEIGVMFRDADKHRMVTAVSSMAMVNLAFHHLNLNWLTSYVIPSHSAAIGFNKGFGAWEEKSDVPGMVKLRLSKSVCLPNLNFNRLLDRAKGRMELTKE